MDATNQGHHLRLLPPDLTEGKLSTWQPRCIARTFATPQPGMPVFTMQTWIDLDAASSPLLEYRFPETEADLNAAVDAFRCGPVDLTPEEAVGLGCLMLDAIKKSFAMILPMVRAGDGGDGLILSGGFGDWLPFYTALISQLGLSCAEAGALAVGKAFALLATHKRNLGMMPGGVHYAQRDAQRTAGETLNPQPSTPGPANV